MTATTENIPAEVVREGRANQRVNIWDKGEFIRQITYFGTEREARAWGLLQEMHDTDPGYPVALAAWKAERSK
jgi:hypothetical protein